MQNYRQWYQATQPVKLSENTAAMVFLSKQFFISCNKICQILSDKCILVSCITASRISFHFIACYTHSEPRVDKYTEQKKKGIILVM